MSKVRAWLNVRRRGISLEMYACNSNKEIKFYTASSHVLVARQILAHVCPLDKKATLTHLTDKRMWARLGVITDMQLSAGGSVQETG